MVEYLCHRCGYNTNRRSNIIQHLNRKKVCTPILGDISIEDIKKHYKLEIKNINQNCSKMLQFAPNCSKLLQNDYNRISENECIYCSKSFSRNSNLTKHLKICKIKIEKEKNVLEKDNEIKELKKMVEKLLVENKGNTNISDNSISNSNNNIIGIENLTIHNYGDENIKYITSDYILNLLKFKPAKAIPELIKHTHFNDAHPENQNIKITNKKGPHIKVRKNNKWELQNKEETITDLIDRQHVHLNNEKIEEKIKGKCSISEKCNIERCSTLYNNDDKEYMKRLYNDSELIVINNS
jgi:hypothetical protein